MEYQDSMTRMDLNDEDYVDALLDIHYDPVSFMSEPSTLGMLKLDDGMDGHMKTVVADYHVAGIVFRKFMYELYTIDLEDYEEEVDAYNKAVTKVKGELPGWKDGTLVIGETRGPRSNRETALSELPLRPVPIPLLPSYYGYEIGDDAEFYSGFGVPTIGMFAYPTELYGMYKNFGMIGQDRMQTMFASGMPDDGDTCDTKYVAINVAPVPLLSVYPGNLLLDPGLDDDEEQQYHDQWEFTITNIDSDDVTVPPVMLTEDEAGDPMPTAISASPFLLQEGGVKLAASATLAAALAFSLY